LGVFPSSIKLYCDGQVALHIAQNSIFHEKMKHIEINCHFIQKKLEGGILTPSHVGTKNQPFDIFTKALGESPIAISKGQVGHHRF